MSINRIKQSLDSLVGKIFLAGFILFAGQAAAQIPDVEVQIVNPLKVTLPLFERNFELAPITPPTPVYPPLVYEIREVPFRGPEFTPSIKPLKLKVGETENKTEGTASIGFGNYLSPLADLYVPLIRKEKSSQYASIRAFHNSYLRGPVDGKNSSSAMTTVSGDYRYTGERISFGSMVTYRDAANNFYGYPEGTEINYADVRQYYRSVAVGAELANATTTKYQFRLSSTFSTLWDRFDAAETDWKAGFENRFDLKKFGKLHFNARYDFLAREDAQTDPSPRNLIRADLFHEFVPVENFKIRSGVRGAYENDLLTEKEFHFYPLVELNLTLQKLWNIKSWIQGDVKKNSLHLLSANNPWLNTDVDIRHINNRLAVGLEGSYRYPDGFRFFVGSEFKEFGGQYFFTPALDGSRFNMIYDDANLINAYAGSDYLKGKSAFRFRADYFGWNTKNLEAAYFRPEWKLAFSSNFSIGEKVVLGPYAHLLAGIQKFDAVTLAVGMMPVVIDLGADVRYSFSERGSLFLRATNLLSRENAILSGYPTRGIQGTIGLTWKF
ncbi:MAG: hypothetical protein FJZ78_02730 [Bacteroidetes bacterium]|nr:hypothetical protein [Bacteroidota bacterium]